MCFILLIYSLQTSSIHKGYILANCNRPSWIQFYKCTVLLHIKQLNPKKVKEPQILTALKTNGLSVTNCKPITRQSSRQASKSQVYLNFYSERKQVYRLKKPCAWKIDKSCCSQPARHHLRRCDSRPIAARLVDYWLLH